MVKFKLKGSKQNSFPIKVKNIGDGGKESIEKIHLNGDSEYDSDNIKGFKISFEELYKQLGSNIIWHEFDSEKEELFKQKEELTDTLKRLQAEFENYKKRVDREKTEFVKYAHADVIERMLPVLDSFEIALKNTTDKEKFVEGIKIIYAQLYSVLEAEGLKPIKATGEKFDPYKHEVLMKQESDKPDDTILEEFQKGYMLNDRVLRHSKVKVSGK